LSNYFDLLLIKR